MLDTGIFFSTDARTDCASGLKAPGGASITTVWDLKQAIAFGSKAVGSPPLFQKPYWLVRFFAGTGSPVAGPDTYYTNDNSGDSESDYSKPGPWRRIYYPGSRSVKESLLLVEPFTSMGQLVTGDDLSAITDAGLNVSRSEPLPSNANAIRFAMGAVSKEQSSHFVVMEVLVTNATLLEANVRVRKVGKNQFFVLFFVLLISLFFKARSLPCAVVTVVEGDEKTGAAEANAWKSRKEFPCSCSGIDEVLNPLSEIENAKWTVTALPIAARCPNDATGEVYLATQGQQPVVFEWSDGVVGRANHRKVFFLLLFGVFLFFKI